MSEQAKESLEKFIEKLKEDMSEEEVAFSMTGLVMAAGVLEKVELNGGERYEVNNTIVKNYIQPMVGVMVHTIGGIEALRDGENLAKSRIRAYEVLLASITGILYEAVFNATPDNNSHLAVLQRKHKQLTVMMDIVYEAALREAVDDDDE